MRELKKMKIWVLWRYAKVHGKKTKVPFAASGGPSGTDEKFRDTWASYEEIKRAASSVKCDGIGFILPSGYFLLDIDNRDLNDPLAKVLLERFGNTYSEYSVSGHGAHVLGKEKQNLLPSYIDEEGKSRLSQEFYQKNAKDHIELYHGGLTGRFATFSGNAIHDVPLADCTEAVLTTLEKNMRRRLPASKAAVSGQKKPETAQTPMTMENLEAEAFDIVAGLRRQKNGEKFTRLYDHGDLTGYGSQSEADLALCTIIAFRTGDNPQLIDHIFRGSKLYREKWEREDYRKATIRMAIEGCEAPKPTHPYFIVFNKQGAPVLEPSLLANYIRKNVTYIIVQDSNTGSRMPYVYEHGVYRYCPGDSFLEIIKKPVMDYNPLCVKMPKIREACSQLMTDPVSAYQEDLNADEHVINFRNGLLYVTPETLTLRPHTPEILSTVQIPCNWNDHPTPTPVFDRYMEQLTGGKRDVEKLLLEVGGVVISNVKGWHMKKALFLFGPGDTGKSVFKTVLEKILGKDNCAAVDLKDFDTRFTTGRMYGKRLVGCSDTSFLRVSDIKMFKTITGGDCIFGEFKGEQGFHFVYNGFLIFGMNRLPMFGGDDGKHVYERIIPVRCNNVIPKAEQDKLLIDKIIAETEGICYQFVRELQTVMANGLNFSEPDSVIADREEYVKENNSVISFFTECMVYKEDTNKASRHTITVIYSAYQEYCQKNGIEHSKSLPEFKRRIAEYKGITVHDLMDHNESGSIFLHYDLDEKAIQEYDPFFRSA